MQGRGGVTSLVCPGKRERCSVYCRKWQKGEEIRVRENQQEMVTIILAGTNDRRDFGSRVKVFGNSLYKRHEREESRDNCRISGKINSLC